MKDLLCLVADANMKASMTALLGRPEALGIRPVETELLVHPRRDPGCFHDPDGLLRGARDVAQHALVLLDYSWDGAPPGGAAKAEEKLEERFRLSGLAGWAHAVVIDPELEAWIFSDSPHVEAALGWTDRSVAMRSALAEEGLWPEGETKPPDPKAAVIWALRQVRKPRSSSIYRDLASRVSLTRCQDRSFRRFRDLLRSWFASDRGAPADD